MKREICDRKRNKSNGERGNAKKKKIKIIIDKKMKIKKRERASNEK